MPKLADFEVAEGNRAFIRAVVEGLTDLEEGRELTLRDVETRLGIEPRTPSGESPSRSLRPGNGADSWQDWLGGNRSRR